MIFTSYRLYLLIGIFTFAFISIQFIYINKESSINQVIQDLKTEMESIIKQQKSFDLQLKEIRFSDIQTMTVLPVIIFAYNRPQVQRSIDSLLKSKEKLNSSLFSIPIFVSQDGFHKETMDVILSYSSMVTYLQHTQVSNVESGNIGYYHLSKHYKDQLDEILINRNHEAVIILEDDIEVSIDFLNYFISTLQILKNDPSLYCISAWNDNGKKNLTDFSNTDLLYRTDFFPGLGWMMLREFWQEIRDGWPNAFWDEYMRDPIVRKNRSCIRPEIGRTTTFGKLGVSRGLFYEEHLQFIHKYSNDVVVDFKNSKTFSFIGLKASYDLYWKALVYKSQLLSLDASTTDLKFGNYRLEYTSNKEFEHIAKKFGIMSDLKRGVPRTAYLGVVTFFMNEKIRMFIAPKLPWTGYKDTQ